jgi:hypothetical protein
MMNKEHNLLRVPEELRVILCGVFRYFHAHRVSVIMSLLVVSLFYTNLIKYHLYHS